jgi:hypothetical protein
VVRVDESGASEHGQRLRTPEPGHQPDAREPPGHGGEPTVEASDPDPTLAR